MSDQPKISCPKCGSDQFHAGRKGFSGKKAVAGAVLTGGIGLLAGTIGSNKILLSCLNCGNKWRPGAALQAKPSAPQMGPKSKKAAFITLAILFGLVGILFLTSQLWAAGIVFLLIALLFGGTAKK